MNFIFFCPVLVPSFSSQVCSHLCFHAGALRAAPVGSSLPRRAGLVALASGGRAVSHGLSLPVSL